MNIEQFDKVQPLLHKAHSIVLIAMCVQDCTHEELDGALWAAKDLIAEALALCEATVHERLAQEK